MHSLDDLQRDALHDLAAAATIAQLDEIETAVLGRKGRLTGELRALGGMDPEARKAAGQEVNRVKEALAAAFADRRAELAAVETERAVREETVDPSEPAPRAAVGHVHPITQATTELVEIFARLGFTAVDGPELESDAYNFEALNIPAWHPARDMQDTFYADTRGTPWEGTPLLPRTQTSPVQIRAMRKYGAPLAVVVPGPVYRNEATDATHDYVFDQIEGLLIAEDVSLAHLQTVFRQFLRAYFGREVPMRMRPGYFPFTEPSVEVELGCQLCDGAGCRVCKFGGWIEFSGAGMVHRTVLEAGGIDPDRYRGFAFGFGLTRLIMQRHRLPDIRLLHSGDLRFLQQF